MISWFYIILNWMYILTDTLKIFRTSLRMLNLSRKKIGQSKELALSFASYAGICMAIPLFKHALKYHKEAIRMREYFDFLEQVGKRTFNMSDVIVLSKEQFTDCLDKYI